MNWDRFKPNIRWSDSTPSRTRSLDQITDLGLATDRRIDFHEHGDEDTGIAALFRAITFITNRVASLPMEQVMGRIVTQETPSLLLQPNPTETYRDTLAKIMSSLIYRGNAYLWVRTRDSDGLIKSIYVLNPDEVTVVGDAFNLYPEYRWTGIPGRTMTPNKEIFHIRFNFHPGRWEGVGPVEAYRLGLERIHAEQALARDLMVNNGTPGGTLKINKPDLTDTEAEAALDRWFMADGHRERRGGPRVMGPTTEYTPLSFKPQDMQFIEQQVRSVKDVAILLGVDPWYLGEGSGGSMDYTNVEHLLRVLVSTTLEPDYLVPIEQTFSLMLPRGKKARFNTDELLRADTQARYEAGERGVKNGMITVNEWRESEGLAPIAGGDELKTAQPALPVPQEEEVNA